MTLSRKVQVYALRVLALVALIGLWAYLASGDRVSSLVLPHPVDVARELGGLLVTAALYGDAAFTAMEILIAFVIACVLGVGVGVLCSRTPYRSKVWEPLFVWGYLAPSSLFFPLFILWFGAGPASKIAFGAVSAFFPIAYSTIRAFLDVDKGLLKVGRAFGASPLQTDVRIKFPSAVPLIAVGLRTGAAMALITVILGEMLASTQGLAFELSLASQTYNSARTYAYMLMVLVIVLLFQALIRTTLTIDRAKPKRVARM